jgi:hypothetical protein
VPCPPRLPSLNSPTYLAPLGQVCVPCPFSVSSLNSPTYLLPSGHINLPCPFFLLSLNSPTYWLPSIPDKVPLQLVRQTTFGPDGHGATSVLAGNANAKRRHAGAAPLTLSFICWVWSVRLRPALSSSAVNSSRGRLRNSRRTRRVAAL